MRPAASTALACAALAVAGRLLLSAQQPADEPARSSGSGITGSFASVYLPSYIGGSLSNGYSSGDDILTAS